MGFFREFYKIFVVFETSFHNLRFFKQIVHDMFRLENVEINLKIEKEKNENLKKIEKKS